jgi:hypothetical protein
MTVFWVMESRWRGTSSIRFEATKSKLRLEGGGCTFIVVGAVQGFEPRAMTAVHDSRI